MKITLQVLMAQWLEHLIGFTGGRGFDSNLELWKPYQWFLYLLPCNHHLHHSSTGAFNAISSVTLKHMQGLFSGNEGILDWLIFLFNETKKDIWKVLEKKDKLHWPGIEPGSPTWRAADLPGNWTTNAYINGRIKSVLNRAMSRPAHVQDFYLLCWFSQLSAILDLGNQADLWQQTSVYSRVLSDLSIFVIQFYCSYRHKIMISDEATESVAVSFLW